MYVSPTLSTFHRKKECDTSQVLLVDGDVTAEGIITMVDCFEMNVIMF